MREVRRMNNNTLSGLSMDAIIHQVTVGNTVCVEVGVRGVGWGMFCWLNAYFNKTA